MSRWKKLPIGIEDFEKLRTNDFYYVDKTGLIAELLDNWNEVNLFTRPRRFGKSLNMNMLQYFFEYGCDSSLFNGLEIAGRRELCEKYMGKFPVVSVSLKDAGGRNFQSARGMMCSVIRNEAMRFSFLSDSPKLSDDEKRQYQLLTYVGDVGETAFILPDEVLADSLLILCKLLHKHYGQKAVLLIDEYDVPLDKAQHAGYYDEMVDLIRRMFGRALKSNGSLFLAVLTGCLRIAKESIFTGLNNLNVLTMDHVLFEEHFGFLDREVREMLAFYGFEDKYDRIREWYDGYRFGSVDVYCPWDVINYMYLLRAEPDAQPKAFWINTSGNDIIQRFIRTTGQKTKREIEKLVAGETVEKKINQELTYRDLYRSNDNIWSVLYMTGYLTRWGRTDEELFQLAIPNREIRKIFVDRILEWFQEEACKDTPRLDAFCTAFARGDAGEVEKRFTEYLETTINVRDTGARRGKKENFYHGILLGLLAHNEDWDVYSNVESGDGFSDILVESEREELGIVIEVKYPDGGDLEAGCEQALLQIEEKGYEKKLKQDGMRTILKYGIACQKKNCRVRIGY